ncbi:hypothetical protein D3OALGB2SA_4052 [Olavius algarvensis associated proteobacterium Delta 3]|nr:hypothetical protein D3OALGB2SA_4052 [Olavius algarvensis associated proteobacterium Delta 3]
MLHLLKLSLYAILSVISFVLWKKENSHSKRIICLAFIFFLGQLILNLLAFPEPKIILDRIDTIKMDNPQGLLIRPKIKNTGNIKAENVRISLMYRLGDKTLFKTTDEKQVDIHMGQIFVLGRFEAGTNTLSINENSADPLEIEIKVKYTGPKFYFWQKKSSIFKAVFEELSGSPFGSRRMRVISNE